MLQPLTVTITLLTMESGVVVGVAMGRVCDNVSTVFKLVREVSRLLSSFFEGQKDCWSSSLDGQYEAPQCGQVIGSSLCCKIANKQQTLE